MGGPAGAGSRGHEGVPLPGLRSADQPGHRTCRGVAGARPGAGSSPALAQRVLAASATQAGANAILMTMRTEVKPGTVLPARRENIVLHTADGLSLVGELAIPLASAPVATLICLHRLPTAGGMMDSHLLRKASFRLPAMADIAVLRFNTRGTASERGISQGEFGGGDPERNDVAAAIAFCAASPLLRGSRDASPRLWLLGWSFGTELAIKWGNVPEVDGAILLSPALRRATDADLDAWAASRKPLFALVPEFDDYLSPEQARSRFARVPQAKVIAVDGAKHLWVGENYVRIALNEIVRLVNPAAVPLPTDWPEEPRKE